MCTMEYFLKQIEPGNLFPAMIPLDKKVVVIGRQTVVSMSKCHRVADVHASFHKIKDLIYIRKLTSHNDIYINSTKMENKRHWLEIGTMIGFGVPDFHESGGFVCILLGNRNPIKTGNEATSNHFLHRDDDIDDCYIYGSGAIDIASKMLNIQPPISFSTHDIKQEQFEEIDLTSSSEFPECGTTTSDHIFINGTSQIAVMENNVECNYIEKRKPNSPEEYIENSEVQTHISSFENIINNSSTGVIGQDPIANSLFDINSLNNLSQTIPVAAEGDQISSDQCVSKNNYILPVLENFYSLNSSEMEPNNANSELEKAELNSSSNFILKPRDEYSDPNTFKYIPFISEFNPCTELQNVETGSTEIHERNSIFSETSHFPSLPVLSDFQPSCEKTLPVSPATFCDDENSREFLVQESCQPLKVLQTTNSGQDPNHNQQKYIKECCVILTPCESQQFRMSSDIKTFNLEVKVNSKDFELDAHSNQNKTCTKQFRSNLKRNRILSSESSLDGDNSNSVKYRRRIYVSDSDVSSESDSDMSNTRVCKKHINLSDSDVQSDSAYSIQNKTFTSKRFRLNLRRRRILSTGSSSDSDVIQISKSSDRANNTSGSANNTRKYKRLINLSDNYIPSESKVVRSSTSNEISSDSENCTNYESDSSLSCKSVIIYPSPHILKKIERNNVARKESCSQNLKPIKMQSKNFPSSKGDNSTNGNYEKLKVDINSVSSWKKSQTTLLTDPKPMKRKYKSEQSLHAKKTPSYVSKVSQPKHNPPEMDFKVPSSKSAEKEKVHKEKRKILTVKIPENIIGSHQDLDATQTIMIGNSMNKCNFKIPKFPKIKNKPEEQSKPLPTATIPKRQSTVPKRPSGFGSRMGFLIQPNLQISKSINKNRLSNKACDVDGTLKSRNQAILSNTYDSNIRKLLIQNNMKRKPDLIERDSNVSSKHNLESLQTLVSKQPIVLHQNYHIKKKHSTVDNFQEGETTEHLSNLNSKDISTRSIIRKECTNDGANISEKKVSKPKVIATTNNKAENRRPKCDSHSVIKLLVHWNAKWLKEQKECALPPPLIAKPAKNVPLYFKDYNAYFSAFFYFIILDIWELMCTACKPILENSMKWNKFHFTVLSCEDKDSITQLQCQSIICERLPYKPFNGNVILLSTNDKEHKIDNCIFGYISGHKLGHLSELKKSREWQKIPKNWSDQAEICSFTIFIKRRRAPLDFRSLMLAHGICNIKQKLDLVDDLTKVQFSPLFDILLQPKIKKWCTPPKLLRYNFIQQMCNEIVEYNTQAKVFLLEGAPGTGKTYSILQLLEMLLFSSASNLKIFVYALSDSAVDEIGLRLIELRERCSWRLKSVKFVRLGSIDRIHPKLHPYHLDTLASKIRKKLYRKKSILIQREIKQLECEINLLISPSSKHLTVTGEKPRIQDLMNRYEYLKQGLREDLDSNLRTNFKSKVLNESAIILSTLNNHKECVSSLRTNHISTSVTCCIVDEAGQCSEPELLKCLVPEICNLVLVGDVKQPISDSNSRFNKSCGFQSSLFERFYYCYENHREQFRVFNLTGQFRMHSEICRYPLSYFYRQNTATSPDEIYQNFPLKPYVVIDILEDKNIGTSADCNSTDAKIFRYFCGFVLQTKSTISVGAITGENKVDFYRAALSEGPESKYVEINTVEGYQGREKDIVIIPCVKTTDMIDLESGLSDNEKFNIALTRARKSLILYGHISSLSNFKHWKALLSDAKERDVYIPVSSITQIPLILKVFLMKSSV